MGQIEVLGVINDNALSSSGCHCFHEPETTHIPGHRRHDTKRSTERHPKSKVFPSVLRSANSENRRGCSLPGIFVGSALMSKVGDSQRFSAPRDCCNDMPVSIQPS